MKATFTKTQHTGKIASNRKENGGFASEYAVIVPRKLPSGQKAGKYISFMQAAIIARIYWSKGGTCYACVWIHGDIGTSGGGKAGGYGYHKASAAMQAALDDAGVQLSEDIAGRGETAMTDALAAMVKALGYKKFHIHHAHA